MSHKLLLADDSVTIQRVIELTFADEDVEVSAVGNGRQAIARIVSDPPDIVLADVGMPEQDGYEVAAFVKNRPDLAHIPVLLLTGAFEPVDEARAESARCDGVLAKPFEPQLLITRVKELLPSRARQVAPADGALLPGYLAAKPAADGAGAIGEVEAGLDMHTLLDAASARHPDADVSLDDYFDRLDRAFADLAGTRPGSTPIPETAAPAATAAAPVVATTATPPPASAVPVAEVFASMLQAEAAHPGDPAPGIPTFLVAQPAVSDELVERIVQLVLGRLAVADLVSATAERLVREEIERLKAAGR